MFYPHRMFAPIHDLFFLLGTKSLHADECIIGTNTPLARQLLNVQLTPLNAGNQLPFSNFNPLWWWLQASKAAPIAGSTWNFMAFCLTSEGMVLHPFFLKKSLMPIPTFLALKFFPMFSDRYITAFLVRETYAHLSKNMLLTYAIYHTK